MTQDRLALRRPNPTSVDMALRSIKHDLRDTEQAARAFRILFPQANADTFRVFKAIAEDRA
jgi:hypothetical protein